MVYGHRRRNCRAAARRVDCCNCGADCEIVWRSCMNFYCKKCGQSYTDFMYMTRNTYCPKGGHCEPYEGRETGPWHCKKCGREYTDFKYMIQHTYCEKGGKCEPF